MTSSVFLTLRVFHILAAALWVGSVVFISMFLMPVLQQSGPEGGAIMGRLEQRGLTKFMASLGGLTILTGIFLYWRLTGGFDAATSSTTEAKVFGAGAVLGLSAGIIGGAVVGRAAKRAAAIGAKLASVTDAKERAALLAETQQLRARMSTWGHIVLGLLIVTVILMSVGHYV